MLGDSQSKRVGRAELDSPVSSPRSSPDAELIDIFHRSVTSILNFEYDTSSIKHGDGAQEEQPEDEMDFRLFASAPSTKQVQSVRIRSPSIETREPSFVQPNRPDSYYFVHSIDAAAHARFSAAAVEGTAVVARSKTACPGCRLPWRVSFIGSAQDRGQISEPSDATPGDGSSARSRRGNPGKKHRIAHRMKAQAKQQSTEDKEAAEREKRTRRNREKKVKRKEKEKAKKAGAAEPV